MRAGHPYRRPSASVVLMVVLILIFALQCINDVYFKSVVQSWLALTPDALGKGFVWQLWTFQFLHGDLLHLIGNLLGLWFFGRFVEHVLGVPRYLLAYFGAGVLGGLLQCGLMLLFPFHFGGFVFGASAGVMGIFAIFCRLQANAEIRWNFILPIRAEVLLWITGAISLFFTIVPSGRGGGVAHAAHLGGLLAGLAFVRLGWHHDYQPLPWMEWIEAIRSRRRARPIVKVRFPKASSSSAGSAWEAGPAPGSSAEDGDFMSKEVDPILDKIRAHGSAQCLTDRERAILEQARSRLDR